MLLVQLCPTVIWPCLLVACVMGATLQVFLHQNFRSIFFTFRIALTDLLPALADTQFSSGTCCLCMYFIVTFVAGCVPKPALRVMSFSTIYTRFGTDYVNILRLARRRRIFCTWRLHDITMVTRHICAFNIFYINFILLQCLPIIVFPIINLQAAERPKSRTTHTWF